MGPPARCRGIRRVQIDDERETKMRYRCADDVVSEFNRLNPGDTWFGRTEMSRFRTRIMDRVFNDGHGGVYFVTSERRKQGRYDTHPPVREYTVRHMNTDGELSNAGEFGGYGSRNGAIGAARRFAERATAGK